MSQFQISKRLLIAAILGGTVNFGLGQISEQEQRLREEFLRSQRAPQATTAPKVTRTRPTTSESSRPSASPSSSGGSRYGYQGSTPPRSAPRPAVPVARPNNPTNSSSRHAPPASRPPSTASRSPRTNTAPSRPPTAAPSKRYTPSPPRSSSRPSSSSTSSNRLFRSQAEKPPPTPSAIAAREAETPVLDRLRGFADRMRELPRTEQAGGYVDASERITTPPKPAPKPVIASTSTSGKKAGPSNPSSTAVSPPKPKTSSSAADLPESVHRGLEFVKANAPTSTDELIEEVSKPLRISPPEIEDLLLPSDMESFGAEEMADHEEKIESMLPGFVPVHYQKPEVEMEYVQAAPLMRATSNLFDFAIKHFVRVPVSASGDGTEPVKAPSGTTVAENPPSTDTPPPGEPEVSSDTEPASQKNAPPPSFDESADPLNGFTITSLHQTDFNLEDSEMVFSGDVFCESPDFQMSCDEFIVHLRKDMKGMAYGEAKGNVVITTVKDGKATGHTGYARHAIYRPDQDNIMLSGWPRIRYGGKEQVAASSSTQMILSTDGQVKTLGRSKTRFVGNP